MFKRAFGANVQPATRAIVTVAGAVSSREVPRPNGVFGADADSFSWEISDLNPSGRLIEYWCAAAVAEELHFTRAANRLHIDQSALSRHIQKLEASLGAKLFIRGERRIELTETAEAFIPFAKKALQAARAGVRLAKSVSRGEPQELEVAFATFVDSGLIAKIRGIVGGGQLRVPVRFRSFPSDQLIGRLLAGESHAAITFLPVQDDIAKMPLLREELLVAVRNDYSLAQRAKMAIGEIADTPVIWPAGVMPPAGNVRNSVESSGSARTHSTTPFSV
jgi:DNA-binding transcriptional LysR family regulator